MPECANLRINFIAVQGSRRYIKWQRKFLFRQLYCLVYVISCGLAISKPIIQYILYDCTVYLFWKRQFEAEGKIDQCCCEGNLIKDTNTKVLPILDNISVHILQFKGLYLWFNRIQSFLNTSKSILTKSVPSGLLSLYALRGIHAELMMK